MELGEKEKNKLFVGGIPFDFTNEQFEELFLPYGKFAKAFVIPGAGYGFVCYTTDHEAEKAKEAMNEFLLEDRKLKIEFARPKKSKPVIG